MMPVLSYTLLSTVEICPHQAYRRYIKKDIPVESTVAMEEGKYAHKSIEDRLRRRLPLPANLQQHEPLIAPLDQVHVEPEQKLGITVAGRSCDFFDPDVFCRGVLDAPFLLATDTAILLDWKTGKVREDPWELELGALLLQAHRPEVTKIYGRYVWLKEHRHGRLHNLSNTERTWLKLKQLAREIEIMGIKGEYQKQSGPLCGWCPVSDCEHNRRKDNAKATVPVHRHQPLPGSA